MTRSHKPKSKRKSNRHKSAPLIVPELKAERSGRRLRVTASLDGKDFHFDTIDFNLATQRDRFLNGVCKRLENADRVALEAKLLELPNTLPPEQPDSGSESEPESLPLVKVSVNFLPNPPKETGTATAELNGEAVFIDSGIDPLKPKHRHRFLNAVSKNVLNLDKGDAEAQLLKIAQQEYQRRTEQQARSSGQATSSNPSKTSEELLDPMPKDIRDEAEAMLEDSCLFQKVLDDVAALGVAGERELTATIYLVEGLTAIGKANCRNHSGT